MFLSNALYVDLSVTVNGSAFLPGETVTGSLRVAVKRDFECTRVRVRCSCTETAAVDYTVGRLQEVVTHTVRDGKTVTETKTEYYTNTETATESFSYYDRTELLAGSASGARQGGMLLQRGTVTEYPFTVALPASVPPSKKLHTSGASLTIAWDLECVVDIPYAPDATAHHALSVLPAIRADTYFALRAAATPEYSITSTLYCSCCCRCFWWRKRDSWVTIRARLFPAALVLCDPGATGGDRLRLPLPAAHNNSHLSSSRRRRSRPAGALSPAGDTLAPQLLFSQPPPLPNPYTVQVCATVVNDSVEEVIEGLHLTIGLRQCITAGGHAKVFTTTVSECELRFGHDDAVHPGETRYVTHLMQLRTDDNNGRAADRTPLNTAALQSRLFLTVDTAGVDMEEPLKVDLPTAIAAAVDFSNVVADCGATHTPIVDW